LFQAFSEQGRVAIIKLNVIARSHSHLETQRISHNECYGFCFRLADNLACQFPPLASVQQFVRLC
jgi:hypothetical protein